MNKPLIDKIQIQSFRSISGVTFKSDQVNLFSGLNDTGKSNILKALNLFFNDQTDFLTPVSFGNDYSKISLASAQRASKKKQLIKIKIYFNPPKNFPLLSKAKEVWIEKTIDRHNSPSEKYSSEDKKIVSQITRLRNSISFFYIPALKGPQVIRYLLGKIGEQQLLPPTKLLELDTLINEKAGDLQQILSSSRIETITKFGLPSLLSDFWEGLSVDTAYDAFDLLEKQKSTSTKPGKTSLDPQQYQISLDNRGDGIKSKFIPPILEWLQKHSNKNFIWAIDEPENSLEFSKAQELSELYFQKYAEKTQLFLTTHSLAFIFPEKSLSRPRLFRCIKGEYGETQLIEISGSLFSEEMKQSLAEEIGILEVQKKVMENYRSNLANLKQVKKTIHILEKKQKPIVLTEGESDKKILTIAAKKCQSKILSKIEIEYGDGASYLKNHVNNNAIRSVNRHCVIAVFDCDLKGFSEFLGLKTNLAGNWINIGKTLKKRKDSKVYALLLPAPKFRSTYVDLNSMLSQFQFLEIEHYFQDTILHQFGIIDRDINGINIITSNRNKKKKLLDGMSKLNKKEFTEFKLIFKKIGNIINRDN